VLKNLIQKPVGDEPRNTQNTRNDSQKDVSAWQDFARSAMQFRPAISCNSVCSVVAVGSCWNPGVVADRVLIRPALRDPCPSVVKKALRLFAPWRLCVKEFNSLDAADRDRRLKMDVQGVGGG
jgi:hypothetical protein